jgi:hypothetical protein
MRWFMLVAILLCVPAAAADMREARRAAADRPRTLIFNNDGCEATYYMTEPTAASLLALRTTPLEGSGVRSIFYCSISSPFGVFTHHTRAGERFETREGRFSNNQTRGLFEAGVDPLAEIAGWCRKHDVECFWSMRMNDTHDSNGEDYAPLILATSSLKRDHPDWLLGSPERRPRHANWSAVDYGRPEIRDLAFRYVEEVCTGYDVDGIELDFMRHAAFFAAPARGEQATPEELAAMTGLLRRIRRMADEAGSRRGRPILLAVRVPDSLEYARAIGLDLEAWLGGGLVDLLVTTSYIHLNPWEYSVALGRRHGVKVYPSLDECRFADPEARRERRTVEAYRARAAAAWAAGVDGIYLFNYFDMQSPLWNELGDRRKLATLDKDYFACYRGPGGTPFPRPAFQNAATLNPSTPLAVEPGWATPVDIHLGDEFAADASRRPAATLRLALPGITAADQVAVTCNGKALSGGRILAGSRSWLEIPVDATLLVPGRNVVALEPAAGSPVASWADLGLRVRFPAAE